MSLKSISPLAIITVVLVLLFAIFYFYLQCQIKAHEAADRQEGHAQHGVPLVYLTKNSKRKADEWGITNYG